jgi:hypothetical protein
MRLIKKPRSYVDNDEYYNYAHLFYMMRCFSDNGYLIQSITVAAPSKAWTVFSSSKTGVVGSNPTRGMVACVRLFCACVFLCAGRGLATGWSPVKGVLLNVYRLKLKKLNSVVFGPQANYTDRATAVFRRS